MKCYAQFRLYVEGRHQALQKFHRVIMQRLHGAVVFEALHLTAGNDNETKFAQNL